MRQANWRVEEGFNGLSATLAVRRRNDNLRMDAGMGPDMRGLDHSWVPLHLAIGWILTRDRDFVGKLPFDGSTRTLAVAIAIAKWPRAQRRNQLTTVGWTCAMQC